MELTRLAPSPTGALHLGNARTFLLTWCIARQKGWSCLLRVEDLDGPRVKRHADRALLDDLAWLGIDWDGPIHRQSGRLKVYQSMIDRLLDQGLAYLCICTRKEVELAASAPHAEDGAVIYPGTCRDRFKTLAEARDAAGGREPAIRFRIPDDPSAVIQWTDGVRGSQTIDARLLGDFVIAKADGTPAYQLAVVVDDAEAGVTQVIRGDDLVDSTPRQMLIYRALGLADRTPQYHHLPLVVGEDGRRLAKRHGDSRLVYYRDLGVPASAIRSLIARWSGWTEAPDRCSIPQLTQSLRVEQLSKKPIIFTPDDDRWLRRQAQH